MKIKQLYIGLMLKYQMSNQLLVVNQLLGVTLNRWPTNFFFCFSSCVLHEPLVCMMKKVLFYHFSTFLIVFDGQNTQQPCSLFLPFLFQIFASVVLLICDRESEEIFYKERPAEDEEEGEGGEEVEGEENA